MKFEYGSIKFWVLYNIFEHKISKGMNTRASFWLVGIADDKFYGRVCFFRLKNLALGNKYFLPFRIDHFTDLGLVTWPLKLTLFWYRPHYFYCASQVVLILVLYQSKVTAGLACIHGQVTKHTTVKWPIAHCRNVRGLGRVSYID